MVKQKEVDYLKQALLFSKENKGFMIALIILLTSILFLQINIGKNDVFEEKSNYAIDMYYNNQIEIESYLVAINEELLLEQDELDEYFLISAKNDFIWLKEKEIALINSKPVGDIYPKEAAFSTFLLKMIELNEAFSIRIGEPDYEYTIQSVQNQQIELPVVFSQRKVIELFEGDVREANIFSNTLNQLFSDYIIFKQTAINESNNLKLSYADSKKLVLLPSLAESE